MWKNKHTLAALIVAPLLSIGGYLLLDTLVGEQPHSATKGTAYPLVALPNCRYSSGTCTLKNHDFSISLLPAEPGVGVVNLQLHSAFALQAVKAALVADAAETGNPETMHTLDEAGKEWQIALTGSVSENAQLRLVVVAGDAFYVGETGLAFLRYKTSYQGDFRRD